MPLGTSAQASKLCWQVLAQRLHFNTFGGNPVCSAGGRAVLRAVDEDGVQENCAKVFRSSSITHHARPGRAHQPCTPCAPYSRWRMSLAPQHHQSLLRAL